MKKREVAKIRRKKKKIAKKKKKKKGKSVKTNLKRVTNKNCRETVQGQYGYLQSKLSNQLDTGNNNKKIDTLVIENCAIHLRYAVGSKKTKKNNS